jgi:hypothetical protein
MANVGKAVADVSAVQSIVDQMVIYAPVASQVYERNVEPGEYVSPGVPLVTLVDLNDVSDRSRSPGRRGRDVRPCTKAGPKDHPLIKYELAARSFIVRSLHRFGLDVEPVRAVGRPTHDRTVAGNDGAELVNTIRGFAWPLICSVSILQQDHGQHILGGVATILSGPTYKDAGVECIIPMRFRLQRQSHDSGRSIFSVGTDLESELPTHLEHHSILLQHLPADRL